MAPFLLDKLATLLMTASIVLLLVLLLLVLIVWKEHRKYDHIPGPKRRSFLRGNFPEVEEKGKLLSELFLEHALVYGPICLVVFFLANCGNIRPRINKTWFSNFKPSKGTIIVRQFSIYIWTTQISWLWAGYSVESSKMEVKEKPIKSSLSSQLLEGSGPTVQFYRRCSYFKAVKSC